VRTVIENVRLGLEVNKKAAKTTSPTRDPAEILDAFGLGAVLDKRPSSSPVACANGWRSLGRSRCSRRCC